MQSVLFNTFISRLLISGNQQNRYNNEKIYQCEQILRETDGTDGLAFNVLYNYVHTSTRVVHVPL